MASDSEAPPEGSPAGGSGPAEVAGETARPRVAWKAHLACFLCLTVLGIAGGAAAALLGRGSVGHMILAGIGFVWVGLPSALIAAVSFALGLLLHRRAGTGRPFLWVASAAGGLAVGLGFLGLSILPGAAINAWDVRAAKSYCRSLVPELEAHRRQAGSYPASLEELGVDADDLPHLLARSKSFYFSEGDSFTFDFVDTSGFLNGHLYDSEARRWEEWD